MVVSETSDDVLVERTARGDRAAFSILVDRHRRRLLALVLRSLGDRMAAEDVVQEVFTRAWVNAPKWRRDGQAGGRGYSGWLARVAVNLSIDQMRKRRAVVGEPDEDVADAAPRADASLIAREDARRIRAAIAALPERQRLAIALTYDAELSNAEGAAAMAVSVGAFELLLVRARRSLRLSLREP